MKFNVRRKANIPALNHEGGEAFTLDARMELYSAVVTTSLNNKFYESSDRRVDRIRKLVRDNDPAFVAKLAVYARNFMNMRSVPLVLAVELAKLQSESGNRVVRNAVRGAVQRADEITELLAYYQLANKRTGIKKLNKLSRQLQHGLADAFNTFDEYQLAKYDRAGAIRLRDALFLVHPKPVSPEQQAIFNKLAGNTLAVPYTWETELSALGQQSFKSAEAKAHAFRSKWEELVTSGKLGYMALLRNLRNILEAGVSYEVLDNVCSQLADASAVAKSKQLPFRFLSAYRELKALKLGTVPQVLEALEGAVQASARNIRGFGNEASVVIACDVSGSMQQPVSPKSKVLLYDVGLMLGMLLQSRCAVVETGMFGDTWKQIAVSRKNILGSVQEFYSREGEVGYSTNGYLVIRDLIDRRKVIDKVMMFTDCQLWNSSSYSHDTISSLWKQYRTIAPKAKLYLFDLAGHGQTPVALQQDGVHLIAGWSDKIFDVLAALEGGHNALSAIENIPIEDDKFGVYL